MAAREYDRLQKSRDDGRDRPREAARATAKVLARRSTLLYLLLSLIFWAAISSWRAAKWVGHRAAYGLLSNASGRLVLALSALFVLLLSGLSGEGLLAGLGIWTVALISLAAAYGARAYNARRKWEESAKEVVKETVAGHNERYPPDLSFSKYRSLPLQDGRWLGHYDFSFRVPSALTGANIMDTEFQINGALRTARDTTYSLDWSQRQRTGRCYARVVPGLPDYISYPGLWDHLDELEGGHLAGPSAIPVGLGVGGVVYWYPDIIPHLLIGGVTGRGKSVMERAVIGAALRYPGVPDGSSVPEGYGGGWRLLALDPKLVELSSLRPYSNVDAVCTEMSEMADTLDMAIEIMQARYNEMHDARGPYLKIHELDPDRCRYLIVVDEMAELTMSSKGKSDEAKAQAEYAERISLAIELLAQKGRGAAIHLMIATQQPGVSEGTMSSKTRMNTPGRIGCGMMPASTSRMLLQDSDVAADPSQDEVKGRGIYLADSDMYRMQMMHTEWDHLDEQQQELGYAPLSELL